jgi:amino acid transporter
MEKKVTSSVMMAVVITLVLIVVNLVVYFTDLWREMWAAYSGFLLLFVAIIVAVVIHGKERENNVTFGRLFGFGFKTVAAVACLMILYTWLFNFLVPEAKEKYLEYLREQTLKNPRATEETADQTVKLVGDNFLLFAIIGTILWYLVLGCIASLIGAAVAKKQPRPEFENV